MFIDNETKLRVNIYAPYKGFSRLDTPEIREKAGVVAVHDPVLDEDVCDLTHYIQDLDYPPYLSCVLKSQKQIVDALNGESEAARASAYANETDALFFKEQRGELPAGTWLAAVAEVKAKYPKYPEVTDG